MIQKEFPNPVFTLTVTFKNYDLGGRRKWCAAHLTSTGFKYLLGQSSFEEAGGLEDLRQVTFIEVYENLNSVPQRFNSHLDIFLNSASTNMMSLIIYVRMKKPV